MVDAGLTNGMTRSPARQKLADAIAALLDATKSPDVDKIAAATRLRDEAVRAVVKAHPTVVAVFREHRQLDRQLRECKRFLHLIAQYDAVPEPSSDVDLSVNTGAEAVDAAVVAWMDAIGALSLDADAKLPGDK